MTKTENSSGKPLAVFFSLSILLMVLLTGVPTMLQKYGIIGENLPFVPLAIIGSWIPNISAVLVIVMILKQKGGVKELFLRWTRWRIGFQWYIVAFSAVIVNVLAALLYHAVEVPGDVAGAAGGSALEAGGPVTLPLLVFMLFLNLVTGAMGEELGWRGFALPRLQVRWNALASSIILGIIWGVWHLPLWFTGFGWERMSFWLFTCNCVAMSVIYTWICNNTRGNMVIVTLFHMLYNFGFFLIAGVWDVPMEKGIAYLAAVLTVYAAILIAVFGAGTLAGRGKPGPETAEPVETAETVKTGETIAYRRAIT